MPAKLWLKGLEAIHSRGMTYWIVVSNKIETERREDLHTNVTFQNLVDILVKIGEPNQMLDPNLEIV